MNKDDGGEQPPPERSTRVAIEHVRAYQISWRTPQRFVITSRQAAGDDYTTPTLINSTAGGPQVPPYPGPGSTAAKSDESWGKSSAAFLWDPEPFLKYLIPFSDDPRNDPAYRTADTPGNHRVFNRGDG